MTDASIPQEALLHVAAHIRTETVVTSASRRLGPEASVIQSEVSVRNVIVVQARQRTVSVDALPLSATERSTRRTGPAVKPVPARDWSASFALISGTAGTVRLSARLTVFSLLDPNGARRSGDELTAQSGDGTPAAGGRSADASAGTEDANSAVVRKRAAPPIRRCSRGAVAVAMCMSPHAGSSVM